MYHRLAAKEAAGPMPAVMNPQKPIFDPELGYTPRNYYDPDACPKHGWLKIRVLHSGAGYYIGTFCDKCGPYDRHSEQYWKTREEAIEAHKRGLYTPTF